jgi:hypothetical protein
MTFPCRVCTSINRVAIDAAMSEPGISDYQISRQFGIPQSSVQRHRTRHLLLAKMINVVEHKQKQDQRQEKERRQLEQVADAYDKGDPHAIALASLTLPAQAVKLDKLEEELEVASERAAEAGSVVALSSLASQRIRVIEVRSKLAMLGGYKPVSAIPQTDDNGPKWSIQIVFPGAGRREEIALVGKTIDGDLNDPPPDEKDVPKPHPNQKIKPDEKLAGNYWDFTKLPDKPADEDDEKV